MGLLDRFRARPGEAITAAATVLKPDDDKERNRVHRGPEPWQREAIDAYYDLAEVSYPTNYQSNALARLRPVPAIQDDPREPPVALDPDGDDELDLTPEERAAMTATVDRLGLGTRIPMSEIQRLVSTNLFLAGDCYLVGWDDTDSGGEAWDVLSVEELVADPNGRGWARRVAGYGSTSMTQSFPEDAFVARLFQRDFRFSGRAYSSMRSVLPLTDDLRILTDAIRAVATSRIPAGIIALSHNFKAGPTNERLSGQRDEAPNDPVVQSYLEHFEKPITNRKSASAVVPFLFFGETNDIKDGIKPIEFNRAIDQTYLDLRAEVIRRIGVGTDLPPEVISGLGDVKYWNAQMIDQSTFKYHLEPDAQQMFWSFTYGYYRPMLTTMGIENVRRCVMWYDPSPLVSHPNQAQDYTDGYDRIEVSGEAWRRVHGVPDDDKPDETERAERIWMKMAEHARTAPIVFPTVPEIEAGDIASEKIGTGGVTTPGAPDATPPAVGPGQSPPAIPPAAGPAELPPGDATPAKPAAAVVLPSIAALTASGTYAPLGPRLTSIEKALRLRLLQAADDATARALEKAGNKLRSLASKGSTEWRQRLAKVDALEVAPMLGASQVETLAATSEDLLAGAFVGLGASWTTWVRRAQEQALAAIADRGDLPEDDAVQVKAAMDKARDEGQAVLLAGLVTLAGALLYAPHVEAPPKGEWSDFRVDPSIITQALREAGGGTADLLGSSGLLSGDVFYQALVDAGLSVNGFVWVHGDPMRDFEEHLLLDGTEFASWDDPLLANTADWPPVEFFSPNNGPEGPDHDGCSCLAMLQVEGAATESGVTEEPL